ncbi:MAG: GntR family transcriptional regulator [Caldisericota bacterium]|nr:GntR family transcriptional regulator [Caldisericota bacterium]
MMKFYINPYKGMPIYRQIVGEVKIGIAKGLLKRGERLPPIREMAIKLSVNPNTVAKAYRELERENIVETIVGRGTFIKK